jgi:hypothetical protein
MLLKSENFLINEYPSGKLHKYSKIRKVTLLVLSVQDKDTVFLSKRVMT